MESAMDSRSADPGAAGAAAGALPLFPPALQSLPDLDRPPAIMEMWELEAVAAALPAKKRRLRETFERLAACSPTPLPFRWEDLDTYISSLQYSVTLRHRQLRQLEKSPKPAPALVAPAPAAVSSLLPVTGGGGGDVGQVRVLENPRPSPVPVLPAVLALSATDGYVRVRSTAAVSAAPADTGVHVEDGKKRKASIQEAEEVHATKRTAHKQEEGQAEMRPRKIQDDAAVTNKTTSLLHDSNGKESMPVAHQGNDDDNGVAAEATASTHDGTVQVQVDPVTKVAVLQPAELPGPAATARDASATNRARVRAAGVANSTGLQRSRPSRPRPVPASGAAASAAAVTGRDLEKSRKRKVPIQEAEPASASKKMQTQHVVREVERRHGSDDSVATTKNISSSRDGGEAKASPRRPGHGTGASGLPITAVTATAQVDADPMCKTGGIRQEPPATMPLASNATSQKVPNVETEEMLQVLKENASMVAKNARRQTQAFIKSEEADKQVSPLPLGCNNSHAQAGAGAATTMPAAAGTTVCKSSSAVTRDTPNLVQASAPRSAGVPAAATRDAPALKSAGVPAAATRDAPALKSSGVPAATFNAPALKSSGVPAATRDAPTWHASRRAPPAAGSQQDGTDDLSPVPPCGGNGLAQSSRVSAGAGAGTQAVSARHSAVVRQGAPATTAAAAPARRDLSTINHVPASRREHTGLSEASAPTNAGRQHVLQKQHMPTHQPISSPRKQQEWSSKHHGGRPTTGSRPVPEAPDDAAAQRSWSRPGEGRGRGLAAARELRGDEDDSRNKDSFKGKRFLFCDKCGCRGHLAETCRTAKHLVALYQKAKAKQERDKDQQICYRCGCTGHWSRNCRTAKHLVDLYQKDRAARRDAGLLQE